MESTSARKENTMHMYQYHTASLHSECPRCGKDVNPGDNAHRRLSDGLVFCDRCHTYGLIPEASHEGGTP